MADKLTAKDARKGQAKTLPSGGGDSGWFERLNRFQQAETLRQVTFKQTHWPHLAPGEWAKNPELTYPHILPAGDVARVFYPPIAATVLNYCTENHIAVHTEALNLRSSQICCFNVLFPLRQDLDLAASALAPLLPGVQAVTAIEFEYTGGKGAAQWLGETPSRMRGQNQTSIDAAIWWTDGEKKYLTLAEWKYTEASYGSCGGYHSAGNDNKDFCRDLPSTDYLHQPEQCYLRQIGRNYWEHLPEAGIDLTVLSGSKGCPFRGPFYQLLRQYLLASYLRKPQEVDEVFVASLHFRGNQSLRNAPSSLCGRGKDLASVWNSLLNGAPALREVAVEDIIGAIKSSGRLTDTAWLEYLAERYGL